ncbi:MAG: hypothetical protein H6622_02315 [Halobacteriovoraceae bacterium]|nr:hypothetical protein [Halobacteriovoraceae bacterium]
MENLNQTDSFINTTWIENLALEELGMEESGVIHFSDHLGPDLLLEESSIQFMDLIRERLELYVAKFNEYRGNIGHSGQIKIFKISNTVNDFMLFRNSLRLIFARKANDLITIGFMSGRDGVYSARLSGDTPSDYHQSLHELRATVGPFNDIKWTFQGENINLDSMAKHYLSEFIRNSSR